MQFNVMTTDQDTYKTAQICARSKNATAQNAQVPPALGSTMYLYSLYIQISN